VISYLDTSAAMKLLVEEAESARLVAYLQSPYPESTDEDRQLVASWLLHAELHCAANRHPETIDVESVGVVLDTVSLIDVSRGDLLTAGALPGRLRSNDAVHLAVALRVGADELITYDGDLVQAAAAAGISAVHPG
jgi:predicted nucleic acid-binding protein